MPWFGSALVLNNSASAGCARRDPAAVAVRGQGAAGANRGPPLPAGVDVDGQAGGSAAHKGAAAEQERRARERPRLL
eukprot:1487216-Pyramimonas_sp.AAC.3